MVFWYLKYVESLKPKIAIIENVPNVLTKKSSDGKTFLELVEKIGAEMGYKVTHQILNAANFGVPQSRKRAFVECLNSGFEGCSTHGNTRVG